MVKKKIVQINSSASLLAITFAINMSLLQCDLQRKEIKRGSCTDSFFFSFPFSIRIFFKFLLKFQVFVQA